MSVTPFSIDLTPGSGATIQRNGSGTLVYGEAAWKEKSDAGWVTNFIHVLNTGDEIIKVFEMRKPVTG